MKGYAIVIDEVTGEAKAIRLEDLNKKKQLINTYFFHSSNWEANKKKQLSHALQMNSSLKQSIEGMNVKTLERIVAD